MSTIKPCPICQGNGYQDEGTECVCCAFTTCPECEGTGRVEEKYPKHNEYRVELTVVLPDDWHVPSDVMEYADELWCRSNNEAPVGADYVLAYIEKQLMQHPEIRIPNISVGKYVFIARSIHLETNQDPLF